MTLRTNVGIVTALAAWNIALNTPFLGVHLVVKRALATIVHKDEGWPALKTDIGTIT